MPTTLSKPRIALSRSEHARLLRLTDTLSRLYPDLAHSLFVELERAELFADDGSSPEVVRMGSTISYETDSGDIRTVTLVYPLEADINASKISILTPIGVALIGLSVGDSIDWLTRDGRKLRLTVTRIIPPAAAGANGAQSPAIKAISTFGIGEAALSEFDIGPDDDPGPSAA